MPKQLTAVVVLYLEVRPRKQQHWNKFEVHTRKALKSAKTVDIIAPVRSPVRNTEAAVVMERAALLATSMEHKQSDVDLAMLWGNLDAAQQGEAGG